MAYKKHEWKARQGTGLNKFRDQNGNVYEFEAAPDEVTQPGTPFSAEWMNEMEAGIAAAGIIYAVCDTAAGTAAKVVNTGGAPEQLANGDNFRILFANEVQAGATLNINGIGAYPIIDNYTGAAIVKGDIPADYIGDIMFEDGKFLLLNALRVSGSPTGSAFFTQDGTFTVPNFVTAIKVSACAAGISPYAGEGIIDQIFNVTPGQTIELTIGSGNTVIGDLITLIAGTTASSTPTTKLGYAAGYAGGGTANLRHGGYGGLFGFGGGGGGNYSVMAGAGGAGIGGNGAANNYATPGNGGGSTGGKGGKSASKFEEALPGGDAGMGKLIYIGGNGTANAYKGGDGSIYGAGGGGGASTSDSSVYGGGGAAGGYGAGGGKSGNPNGYGQPSGGMVLIEWGGTVA